MTLRQTPPVGDLCHSVFQIRYYNRQDSADLLSRENGPYCPDYELGRDVMNKKRYREILEELDMSQRGAARLLGISERSSRRFAAGDDIPQMAAILLEIMRAKKITPEEAFRIAGIKRPTNGFADSRVDA